ncbi:hypothetical protein L1987_15098 [Smallanthus sonchifolius]|uniref:Uncharacterized protein n=1 Tax=Smallanthus sonchifolius TaxID=185202 RepID=A0ACB9J6V8_9ASTR|nr:hypothetical protein L1987_15098 [Smallanthus sonchifolius]
MIDVVDSPVFNYINSLSPIKPVKSVHFTQTFSTLSFASLPSVFTSPRVSSLKDSKFLKRHQFSDPSKPELTSEDAKTADTSEGNLKPTENPLNQHTRLNSSISITDTSVEPSNGCSNFESRKLSYEAVCPDTNTLNMVGPSASSVPFINNGSENGPFRTATEIEVINQLPHSKELSACDWDSLISDDSELLNFNSPSDTLMNAQPQGSGDNPSENDEGLQGAAENHVTVASTSLNDFEVPMDDTDNEGGSNLYRGMRRRCLLFEMTGSRRKHLEDVSNVDHKVVKHEISGSGRQLIIAPLAGYPSTSSGQELVTALSDAPPFENDTGPAVNVAEDAFKARGFVVNDELSQTENAGEAEDCKRCNCKKSKCLKLHVHAMNVSTNRYMKTPCLQHASRLNPATLLHLLLKLSKPLIPCKRMNLATLQLPLDIKEAAIAKKSGCLKKYCECYQGGVGCSINCRCEGCKNTFGRKDGSDMDLEANECDGNGGDGSLPMILHIEAEPVSATPATPATPCFGRQSIPLLNPSKGKPPRSFLAIGSSSNQRFGKLNPFKGGGTRLQLQRVGESEIPDILEENNGSPTSGSIVKSCSPNSKRVSPPHSIMGPRISRKLILQSIPSFPCLTPNPKQ